MEFLLSPQLDGQPKARDGIEPLKKPRNSPKFPQNSKPDRGLLIVENRVETRFFCARTILEKCVELNLKGDEIESLSKVGREKF
ncbi:MAG TPA: hypothetical protein VK508_04735 [Cyclobacteriaceae bacterium]|nr:hypothetical protein [Cyclobacteriaceae bacterium]